eukprot:7147368-Pyramimonas_sp.AAC.1
MFVGLNVRKLSWAKPIQEHQKRCRHTRGPLLGRRASMLTHNTFTQPVLSYVAQCHTLTDDVLKAERAGLQRLTASPRHSSSPAMMYLLKDSGLSHQPRPISVDVRFALCRVGLRSEAL